MLTRSTPCVSLTDFELSGASQSWKDKHYDSLCKFPQGAKLLDTEVASREGWGQNYMGTEFRLGKLDELC